MHRLAPAAARPLQLLGLIITSALPLLLLLLLLSARSADAEVGGVGIAFDPQDASPSSSGAVCNAACMYRQRQALAQFHARMNGRYWLKQRDWLSDKDHCLWEGVACCVNYTHISNAYLLDDETGGE
jgi:hypothetical protein